MNDGPTIFDELEREKEIGKFQDPDNGRIAETQRLAAISVYPKTGTWRRKVLDAITESGEFGLTDEQIQRRLDMNPSTQRPRRVELVERGLIKDSGRRRRTSTGRQAVIWIRA